jgi:protein phosphatase methylesterase 1
LDWYIKSKLEWFEGLTKCFLSIKVPKILLLAGCERMDKELTIAQMQGRFKLSVIGNVGHIVHEDDPKSTFELIDEFIKTFRISGKLSDMKPIVGKLGSSNPKNKKYEDI